MAFKFKNTFLLSVITVFMFPPAGIRGEGLPSEIYYRNNIAFSLTDPTGPTGRSIPDPSDPGGSGIGGSDGDDFDPTNPWGSDPIGGVNLPVGEGYGCLFCMGVIYFLYNRRKKENGYDTKKLF